jgi:phage terminase large subunit-like protein
MKLEPFIDRFITTLGMQFPPFQRRIARAISGPGTEVVISTPRGQGKTALAALVAIHHLFAVQDARAYLVAASAPQASIAFDYADRYARLLQSPHVVNRHHELRWCPDPSEPTFALKTLKVLASDAPRLHGLAPSLIVLDELQAISNPDVYVALSSALHKRAGAKMVVTSTAAGGNDTPLGRLRSRALAGQVKRRGAVLDARSAGIRWLEWSAPEDAPLNLRTIRACNPAPWITNDQLREQKERLPETAFRRFVLNQWVEHENYWLPAGAWQACAGETHFVDGERIWVGVDIGGTRADSAVVWINKNYDVGVEIFSGDEAILQVADAVRDLATRYRIAECSFDPWRAGQIAAELEQRSIRVSAFPQHDARMIPASQRLYDAVREKRITHPDDEGLNRHVAAAIARHSRRGWRIDKPNSQTKIDAVVALAMAVDRRENQPQPVRLLGYL